MKHFFYLLAVASLLFASCSKPFKKAEGGLQYKIISNEKGKLLKNGNFFEIQFDQVHPQRFGYIISLILYKFSQ